MSSYKFVTNYDDWEGLYDVDGLLIDEGHEVNFIRLFNEGRLDSSYKINEVEVVGEWLQWEGNLPPTFKEFEQKEKGEVE